MRKLPSGLNAFEPSDAVRREAQNANIEVLDKFINNGKVHRHTGKPGDAPQIGNEGISSGSIDRHHLNSGKLSGNIAKYKPVTITGGELRGLPTAPYYISSSKEYNWWRIPKDTGYPQSITIHLEDAFSIIEAVSFEFIPAPQTTKPFTCIVEVGSDNEWKEVFNEILDGVDRSPLLWFAEPKEGSKVRLTLNGLPTDMEMFITRLAVYSQSSRGLEEEPLEDRRPWGLVARMQGLLAISPNPIIDNSNSVTLGGHIYVLNPMADTYFVITAGTFPLLNNEYLYAEFNYYHNNGLSQVPSVGKADYNNLPHLYARRDNFILLYRFGGKIYLHPLLQAKLQTASGAPINLQAADSGDEYQGALQMNNVLGIKKVQRGVAQFPENKHSISIQISPVQVEKSIINVTQKEEDNNGIIYNASLRGRIISSNEVEVSLESFSEGALITWEVIEYA